MQKLLLGFLFLIALSTISFAQSGRRIQNPIPGTSSQSNKTEIITTETQSEIKEETTGFSESSPNQPVSIYIDRQNRRNKKSDKNSKNQTVTATPPTSTATTDDDVVKVETNLISIPVTVSTKNGSYVPSLSKGNFQIFENGKEQEVAYFGSVDKPFTVILLLDVSGSTSLKIEQIQDGAISFVQQMLPQDKAMVIAFDSGVRTLLEYSSDKNALEAAIRKLRFGGGTSLYDAVDQTLERKISKIEGKKAVVLFTDGVDTTSRTSYERTVASAIESEAVIFPIYLNTYLDAIGISGGGPMQTPATLGIPGMGGTQQVGATREQYALGRRYLQDLANATGGRIYRPDNSSAGLNSAFAGIAEELRSQYEVGYYPSDEAAQGDVKKIKIRINRPNLIIRSRDSYVVK